jgi:hypothetical protein
VQNNFNYFGGNRGKSGRKSALKAARKKKETWKTTGKFGEMRGK